MLRFLKAYQKVDRNILYLIVAELFLQLINTSFTLILNLYMTKSGYPDHEIASFTAYRFMSVVLFALPFGLYIRGRSIRPMLLLSAVLLPVVSLIILEAVSHKINWLLQISLIIWGICFTANQIAILPFILRNSNPAGHTESISLNASVWSFATIVAGLFIWLLSGINPHIFTDKLLLQIFSLSGFAAAWFIWQMPAKEEIPEAQHSGNNPALHHYDWDIIAKAIVPTTMIAVGAGLTIPFMNLFFFHVFGLNSDSFSLLGSVTGVVVALFSLQAPLVKRKFGYEAITGTQLLAIVALMLLGATDFISHWPFALYIAAFCFIIRQPLMNLANPMTSQMTMYYVGKKNQELVSAITSSIWSGSWFFSSLVFRYLREMDLRYGYIIYITAAFYVLGVFFYHLLIKDFRRKEQLGLI
ncbi:MFS transporter [Sphingobacteriales bacterium UPWRP_1]|nr:hypothetical protein BVG80_07440 [Sphingobacteriales bacterium TSM_CSM]PSJ74569.1 MFS transporter [Sphingobacteriales bacterium UPWRP_1]